MKIQKNQITSRTRKLKHIATKLNILVHEKAGFNSSGVDIMLLSLSQVSESLNKLYKANKTQTTITTIKVRL